MKKKTCPYCKGDIKDWKDHPGTTFEQEINKLNSITGKKFFITIGQQTSLGVHCYLTINYLDTVAYTQIFYLGDTLDKIEPTLKDLIDLFKCVKFNIIPGR